MSRQNLGTVTYDLSGSPSTKRARLDITCTPSPAWQQGNDLFLTAGWLLFVECEATFIPSDLLPLALGTLIGKMSVYFEYGTAGKPMPPDPGFKKLATVELELSLDRGESPPKVVGLPQHRGFSAQVHPGALAAMAVTDSIEAMSAKLSKSALEVAFYSMTYGLEKWARTGMPRKNRIPATWDLLNIPSHAKTGEKIVTAGWLAQQEWPLRPLDAPAVG